MKTKPSEIQDAQPLPPFLDHEGREKEMCRPLPVGTSAIYALHGKCSVEAVEEKLVDGRRIFFYKLAVLRSNLSRTNKPEPAIWVPIGSAQENGLRAPISAQSAAEILAIIASEEYFFPLQETWSSVQPKLEATIRKEGATGLAKVTSYLFILKMRRFSASSEISKMFDSVSKLLTREISEATETPNKEVEQSVLRSLRKKLARSQ